MESVTAPGAAQAPPPAPSYRRSHLDQLESEAVYGRPRCWTATPCATG
jgi:hypothetical protein